MRKLKGIYLASYKASHPNYDIVYQDINGKRDLGGDMMDIDLSNYDFIIATPPCNYWSRANYRRDRSPYALKTKNLLPDILKKLCSQSKPFIVENVRNSTMFAREGLFNLPCFVYIVGRHTYWSNILIITSDIEQRKDNVADGVYIASKNCKDDANSTREGGWNVHQVIERFLETLHGVGDDSDD